MICIFVLKEFQICIFSKNSSNIFLFLFHYCFLLFHSEVNDCNPLSSKHKILPLCEQPEYVAALSLVFYTIMLGKAFFICLKPLCKQIHTPQCITADFITQPLQNEYLEAQVVLIDTLNQTLEVMCLGHLLKF